MFEIGEIVVVSIKPMLIGYFMDILKLIAYV